MSSQVFEIESGIDREAIAEAISDKWVLWDEARGGWDRKYHEVLQYLYATDTDQITSQKDTQEQYSSNVHVPKLTQLGDLLVTYYGESLFSLSDYITFEATSEKSLNVNFRTRVKDFVKQMLNEGKFRETTLQLLTDYVQAGNAYAMPVWKEQYHIDPKTGFKQLLWSGAVAKRINPLDISFDPGCTDFNHTAKIIRTVVSLGDLKQIAEANPEMQNAFNKALENRRRVSEALTRGDTIKEDLLFIAGFQSFSQYLASDTVELLEFYGDYYDVTTDTLKAKKKLTIMDRSVLLKEEDLLPINNYNYIFKTGWRDNPNSLWSMSPLENLLGMQYRIDFLENRRSDIYDFVSNPQYIIKGDVTEPEQVGPGAKWRTDKDGDVRYLYPDASILAVDNLINQYEMKMEAFAGAPREALGFRTQGEKTAFEVQQLANAAVRVFNRQIRKYEIEMQEPLVNALLELFLYKNKGLQVTLKTVDNRTGLPIIEQVSVDDLHGEGAIKAVGSEYYADKAKTAQTLQALGNSALFMSPEVLASISPSVLGQIFVEVSDLNKYEGIYRPNCRLYESVEQQKIMARAQQQVDEIQAASLAATQRRTGVDLTQGAVVQEPEEEVVVEEEEVVEEE